MTDAFDHALRATVGREGGCTRSPADAGNPSGGAPGRGTGQGKRRDIPAVAYPLPDTAGTIP